MDAMPNSKKRKHRKIIQIVMLTIGFATIFAGWNVYRWYTTPSYWTTNQAYLKTANQDQLIAQAQRAEQVVFNGLASSLNGQVVDVVMSIEDVNAWLAVRMKIWLANLGVHLNNQIGDMMVAVQGQKIILAIEMRQESITQIISLVFTIHVNDNGQVALKLESLRAGNLPLKASWLAEQLAKLAGKKNARKVKQIIAGQLFGPWFAHPAYADFKMKLHRLQITQQAITASIQTKRIAN